MSLVAYTITAIERDQSDATASGKQVVVGASCSMFIQPSDSAVTMYDDVSGSNGSTAKVTGANGQVTVYVEPGQYRVATNGISRYLSITSAASDVGNVALLKASSPVQGQKVSLPRYYDGGPLVDGLDYFVKSASQASLDGDVADGSINHSCANGNVAVIIAKNSVTPQMAGVDPTGAVDSQTHYINLRTLCNTLQQPLNMNNATILINSEQELPQYGLVGKGGIKGATARLSRNRQKFNQSGGTVEFDNLHLSGLHYSKWFHVRALTVTIDGNANDYGTFWNDFGTIEANINIDVGELIGQSVNQNLFPVVRGHLHIYGGSVSNPNPQECDQNIFEMIDTTSASITASDGTTGWHILNESFLNQRNVIKGWYSEGAGNKAVRGNFHVQSAYVDSSGSSPYAIPPTAHVIFNPDHSTRNQSDYFAIAPVNAIKGGDWSVLDARTDGQPVGVSKSGGTSASVSSDATEPTGLGFRYGGVNTVDFRAINITLPNNFRGRYTLFFWLKVVAGNPTFQTFRGGSTQSHSTDVYYDGGNDWRLYRISTATRTDGLDDVFQLLFRAPSTEMYLGCVWGTPYKSALLPYPSDPECRIGVTNDNTISTVPEALPVGGRIINTSPTITAGTVIEYVKSAPGGAKNLLTMPA